MSRRWPSRFIPLGSELGVQRLVRIAATTLGVICTTVAVVGVLGWLIGRIASDRYIWSQWLLWIPTPAVLMATLLGLAGASPRPRGPV